MDTVRIPKQYIAQHETLFDKIKLLNEVGLHLSIDKVNWPNEFPKTLPVSLRIAHDNEKLFLYYQIEGEKLRVQSRKDFMSPWLDSCVEFFVQQKGDKAYRNFEFNVFGALLATVHETRELSENLSVKLMSSIVRFSTIRHYYKVGEEVSDWTLYVEIPKEAIGFTSGEKMSGQAILANFYKCGDETPEPHFISWKPINTPEPNFHVPQFFGELTLD
ncbi:MAG: carbohydrate-binding family 9-like protein [Dysgonamonadaceae bacterium]|nr:carbohydrate-binding family 9-like protein [Dysgonamonadaceae bacterium]MDD4727513.1 carbohydrate-binding family 9-like protein [Dysgonamonadaceae bacterium]